MLAVTVDHDWCFRCFGLLISPGRNVKHSDMQLIELVRREGKTGRYRKRESVFVLVGCLCTWIAGRKCVGWGLCVWYRWGQGVGGGGDGGGNPLFVGM